MRLLFLCSSAEPGRDGVGDQTRLLAEACARQGHEVALAALHDPFVAGPGESHEAGVPLLRLPAASSWAERRPAAAAFREKFRPDWVSLQLVPYAFHPRGVLFGMTDTFAAIAGPGPLHLMFHEVWLGGGEPTPWRQRLTGFFQRRAIARLLCRLRPRVVTTSNPVYAAMLREAGARAGVLPLFGNVPIREGDPWELLREPAAPAGLTPENRAGWQIGLFFGSLHAEWQPEPFLGRAREAAALAGKRLLLVLAGRAGAAGEATWREMEKKYAGEVSFLAPGGLPTPVLSAWLREADYGVAATPWQLIGKSGTVAAMLDHGLPVIVTRDDFQPDLPGDTPPSADPLLHRLDDALAGKLAAGLPKRPPRHGDDAMATRFLSLLRSAAPEETT